MRFIVFVSSMTQCLRQNTFRTKPIIESILPQTEKENQKMLRQERWYLFPAISFSCIFLLISGTATRQCLEINGKAQWTQPDLSLCVSPTFHAFSVDADKLAEAEEVTADALNNITSGIGEAVTNKNRKRLYAGDLTSASITVNKLATLVQKVNPDITNLGSITEVTICFFWVHATFKPFSHAKLRFCTVFL